MTDMTVLHSGWIRISLTEEMIYRADQHARKMQQKMGGKPLASTNYWADGSGPEQHVQDFIDGLGSEALRCFLIFTDIPYLEYEGNNDHFEGDEYDFFIHNLRWDLKTAHAPQNDIKKLGSHYGMLISTHQIDKAMDGYIHIQLEKDLANAYIIGYISHKKAQTFAPREDPKMKSPAVFIPFTELQRPAGLHDPDPLKGGD